MKKHLLSASFAFALCLVSANASAVEVGEQAPDFTLSDINQKPHSLSDSKGKYMVLELTNPDCPFVKKHYDSGNMQSLQKEYTAKGVEWFTVASSAPGKQGHYGAEEWQGIATKRGDASSAILLDADGTAGKAYGAKTTPHLFIVNPEGSLIYQGAIDDKPSVEPADVKTAKNHVKAALDEAMSGQAVTTASTDSYGCSVKY